MGDFSGVREKGGEMKISLIKARRRREIFEDFCCVFARKRVQNALKNVFLIQKRLQNTQKFPPAAGIFYRNPLSECPKVKIFRACGESKSVFLCSMLSTDRAPLQKVTIFVRAAAGQNHNDF